ncbi:MAG: hypothetical protein KJ621_19300, partial [Proteobacteria bacterium]|nr:hypothetical protein [Pseudomonadota bacterium]
PKILARIKETRPRPADRLRQWLSLRPLPMAVGAVVAAGLVVAVIGFFPQILSDPALRRASKVATPAGPPPPKPTITRRADVSRTGAKPADDKVKPSPETGKTRGVRVAKAPGRRTFGGRPARRSSEGTPPTPTKKTTLKTIMPYMVRKTPPPRPTRSTLVRRKTTSRFHRPAVRPSPEPAGRLVKKTVPPPKAAERSVKPRTSTPRGRPERALPARQKPAPPPPAGYIRVARRSRPPAAQVRQAPGDRIRPKAVLRTPADRRAALPQNLAMVLSLVERYHGRVIKPDQRTSEGIVLKVVIPRPQRKVFLIRLDGLKRHGVRRLDRNQEPIRILVTSPAPRTR